jgi:hypothetical protein
MDYNYGKAKKDNVMTPNLSAVIDRKIKKLQQLRDLLADSEMAELVQAMFVDAVPKPATGAPSQGNQLEFPKLRRKYQRTGGSLLDQTYKSLLAYHQRATAKDLADFMQRTGYRFKAKDPNIAVSKALRLLAEAGKITAQRGDNPKAAITYWIPQPDSLQELTGGIPVQVETRH